MPVADPPSKARNPRNTKQRALKLDTEKVDELHSKGVGLTDIARSQGVAKSTVWRYLASIDAEKVEIERYRTDRAEVFTKLQAQSLELQSMIMQSLVSDGILVELTPHQKTGMLAVLSAQHGTLYDKERLEKGQSTSNVSMVHRMMSEAFDRAGKTTISSAPISSTTPDESPS